MANSFRRISRGLRRLAGCVTLVLLPLVGVGADADPLFTESGILDITLDGPFTTIDRDRDKEIEYPGTLTYTANGGTVTLAVDYSVRGNFRLRDDICNFSQLWLDFPRKETENTLFANQNNLKLVVQCKNPARYSTYVAREHQAYQLFNALTDLGFRSRLINVTWIDNARNNRERNHLGIFIEHKDRLAARTGLENVDLNRIERETLDPVQGTLVSLFMFMIGNTDFSLISAPEDECCHNAKLLQAPGVETYYPAPYDFDSSGYVDASYAQPDSRLKLRSVRQRLYRGFCVPDAVMQEAVARFLAAEEQMLAIATDTSVVSDRDAKESTAYLEAFFAILKDPDDLKREILDDCRG